MLEATIGFNKREAGSEDESGETPETLVETEFEEDSSSPLGSMARIKFTTQDEKFLRALKISIDEQGR